jgi:hypothetical protein
LFIPKLLYELYIELKVVSCFGCISCSDHETSFFCRLHIDFLCSDRDGIVHLTDCIDPKSRCPSSTACMRNQEISPSNCTRISKPFELQASACLCARVPNIYIQHACCCELLREVCQWVHWYSACKAAIRCPGCRDHIRHAKIDSLDQAKSYQLLLRILFASCFLPTQVAIVVCYQGNALFIGALLPALDHNALTIRTAQNARVRRSKYSRQTSQ